MTTDAQITSKNAASEVVDDAPSTSWYLIVSTSTAVATRVVDIEDGAELVIGRIARCDIAIDHDSVSRRHAVLRRSGETVTVADLESRNGTLVNGTLIEGPPG